MDVSGILKGEPEARWYTVVTNGGANEPRVKIRTPPPKVIRDLGLKTGTGRVSGRLTERDLAANRKFQDELMVYMIDSWENINSGDTALECNAANKALLVDNWYELFTLMMDVLDVQRVSAEEAAELEEKN